jgi:hypothetical protein
MMDLKNVELLLKNHEERIVALEKTLKLDNGISENRDQSPDYTGLVGGVRYLIDEKFFNTPKKFGEIFDKLKENGYHYDKGAVQKTVSSYFMKRDKILTRFKEENAWKYVIKK